MSKVSDGSLDELAVQRRIDQAGVGRFQLVSLLLTGGVMFSEGSEMLIMGSVTTLLKDHWELSAAFRGSLVAIVFIGFAIGNLCSGLFGDNLGRRPTVLIAYGLIGALGIATASSLNPIMMVILRFFVGFGCGIGFPAVYALVPELSPSDYRGTLSSVMIGFMPLGELFAALMVWEIDPDLDRARHCTIRAMPTQPHLAGDCTWRALCEVSALPAFVFLSFAMAFLPESPIWLTTKIAQLEAAGDTEGAAKRRAELERTLALLDRWNGTPSGPSETTPLAPALTGAKSAPKSASYWTVLATLSSKRFLVTTLMLFLAHFTKDFAVFGLTYSLPQVFKESASEMVAGQELTITALLAIPGVFLALLLCRVRSLGRRPAIQIAAGVAAVACFGVLTHAPVAVQSPSAYTLKFCAMAYFILVVVYTSEVFPTWVRTSAIGHCAAVGRLGSISAPVYFEATKEWYGHHNPFILTVAGLMAAVSICGTCGFQIEPRGKPLAEEDAEVE